MIGISQNRRARKPERAYRRFSGGRPVPGELVQAVERVVAAARGEKRRPSAGGRPPRARREDGGARS